MNFNNLNSNQLKILAIIFMTIDHIGTLIFPNHMVFRYIGRLTFPIFAFLLTVGYKHTSNKNRYIFRLLLLGIASQGIYSFAFNTSILNIMFTLTLGLVSLKLYDKYKNVMVWILFMLIAQLIGVDYGPYGVALIYVMTMDDRRRQTIYFVILNAISFLAGWPLCQSLSVLSLAFIYRYDGSIGKVNLKYLFYIFYPLHILIIKYISIYTLH